MNLLREFMFLQFSFVKKKEKKKREDDVQLYIILERVVG